MTARRERYVPSPYGPRGPCPRKCTHLRCALWHADAADVCGRCGQPIGYDQRFFDTKRDGKVHAMCDNGDHPNQTFFPWGEGVSR